MWNDLCGFSIFLCFGIGGRQYSILLASTVNAQSPPLPLRNPLLAGSAARKRAGILPAVAGAQDSLDSDAVLVQQIMSLDCVATSRENYNEQTPEFRCNAGKTNQIALMSAYNPTSIRSSKAGNK